ncbi:progesterone receptor-like [Nerophis ophidion]|uniref:progesterone receptor-like n=1 Tax=Nerophis ophidion TaxID=159077 RepID=UPI002ADF4E73|nr:progesterone receptor-like [Nerophis ophidion]
MSRAGDVMEGGYAEPQSSYGDSAASSGGDVFPACSLLDTPHLFERAGDVTPWEHLPKVQGTGASAPDTLAQGGAGSSLVAACKFIKDEEESSVIMEAPCPEVLDTCRKQSQFGFGDPEFAPVCARPSQGNLHLDAHLAVYKGDIPRWQVPVSSAEAHFWCQPAEEHFSQGVHSQVHNQVHNQGLHHRTQTPFSAFHGLPPQRSCVICGDEASGCHYGVVTCGSCKVFFKRAVEGHHSYLCAGRNDCIVDKIRRKNCPACRLRKCYQAGMMLGGRKLKRFGAYKALGLSPSMVFQSHLGDPPGLPPVACVHDVQYSHQMVGILENIEPEMVYSGYDSLQAEGPHLLLNSLNRLCEKQLLWIVKWSKSLPGFRNLHINDQMTLIQYSWMNLMVFSLGWRSFQNVSQEFLYFAPDLVLSQEQMRKSPIYELCLAIQFIPQEFSNLQVTRDEFLCMKAIILLNTVPLEGLKSQPAFEEMRQNYIRELSKAVHVKEKSVVASSQRFYHLTKLMDAMHDIVKKVNLFCLSTFIQADAMKVEFPEMMTEVIASQLPKVLAGMVRPLLFHPK